MPGVLDEPIGDATTWTRVNVGEAYPGVPTPLTWSWAGPAGDIGLTAAWARMGVFPAVPEGRSRDPAKRSIAITSGRVVLNLDVFKALGDRIPFNSGDKVEQNFFSSEEITPSSRPVRSRYPIVAVKLPVALVAARRSLLASVEPTATWWRRSVRRLADDPGAAPGMLRESADRYRQLVTIQGLTSLSGQGLYEAVVAICARYGGDPGLLTTSTEHTAATRTVEDLWQLSRNRLALQDFLDRHGYQSPVQGELAVPSWRVDPAPVLALAATFAERADGESAAAAQARRIAERDASQRTLLREAPRPVRPMITRLLGAARAVMPLREIARNQFLQAYDVARAAANRLDNSPDACCLTVDELAGRQHPGAGVVEERRTLRAHYEAHEIPMRFTGVPPLRRIEDTGGGRELTGIGASGGVAEGPARIVDDTTSEDLREGEILVAETTNPSYAAHFLVAAGVVVDIGGMLSHGAVVAREMGIPCVINTRTACRAIRTGDLVRVDGNRGTVEIVRSGAQF